MSEARSFYLGPSARRLIASTWDDIVTAAAAGVLDETHWVELKQDIPPASKPANRELAKDLASLSVDGGVLIVGIEDHDGSAGKVVGTELFGLADRISQVAAGIISPPLSVASQAFDQPSQPGRGVLVVTVPASLGAPHMVEKSYWGRGDQRKRPLSDDEVRRLLATRLTCAQGFEARLRALADDLDPVRGDHEQGHIYVMLEPASAGLHALLSEAVSGRQVIQLALEGTTFEPHWSPSWRQLQWGYAHPDGLGARSFDSGQPQISLRGRRRGVKTGPRYRS